MSDLRVLFGHRPWYVEVGIAARGMGVGLVPVPAFMLRLHANGGVAWAWWWVPWMYALLIVLGLTGLVVGTYLTRRWKRQVAQAREAYYAQRWPV